MNMTTTTHRSRNYHAKAIDGALRAVTSIRRMVDALNALPADDYRDDEVQRLERSLAEMEEEVDFCMQRAIADGYGPEDF